MKSNKLLWGKVTLNKTIKGLADVGVIEVDIKPDGDYYNIAIPAMNAFIRLHPNETQIKCENESARQILKNILLKQLTEL